MVRRSTTHGRAELLIAVCRVALAVFSVLAIRLDPSGPARYAGGTRALLGAYLAYALAALATLLGPWKLPGWWKARTRALDLAAFLGLMLFTNGPSSPFFVYFT